MSAAWRDMLTGTKEERITKMRNPELREAAKSEKSMRALDRNAAGIGGRLPRLLVQSVANKPELEKYVGKSLSQIATEEDKHPVDVMIDLSLATELKAEFLQPEPEFNAEFNAEIITNSMYTFPGVSDGGAHTKFFTGGAFTTDFLSWLVRDEQKVTLEEAPSAVGFTVTAAGFRDRGVLREGAWADVVVYELNGLGIELDWSGNIVMICQAANGAECNMRAGIARSSSTGSRRSPKANVPRQCRGSCSVMVGRRVIERLTILR